MVIYYGDSMHRHTQPITENEPKKKIKKLIKKKSKSNICIVIFRQWKVAKKKIKNRRFFGEGERHTQIIGEGYLADALHILWQEPKAKKAFDVDIF